MRKTLQYISFILLLTGYVYSSVFGPNSVQGNIANSRGDAVFSHQDPNSSPSNGPRVWGVRRYIAPENHIEFTPDVVLSSFVIPEYRGHQIAAELSDHKIPTSSPHFTPRPRDPPLTGI